MPMGSHLWTNSGGMSAIQAGVASSATASGASAGTFLLSQLSDEEQSEDGLDERRKRSHFVEELVIASLASEDDDEAGDDDKS
jgi:hypothetical protein